MFLINRRYRFEEGLAAHAPRRSLHGGAPGAICTWRIVPVTLTVLDRDDERTAPKRRADNEPQRARSRTSRRCSGPVAAELVLRRRAQSSAIVGEDRVRTRALEPEQRFHHAGVAVDPPWPRRRP
jgi:hypothetical protein